MPGAGVRPLGRNLDRVGWGSGVVLKPEGLLIDQ